MSQGPGGPPRWPPGSGLPPGHPAHRSPSPFRGPPPRPGWASPIPPRMTQSPPPFLIRPMVGGHHRGTASPIPGSPIPFLPPPRWSPSPVPNSSGTPVPLHFNQSPHPMMAPRPFFRPIMPGPSPPPPQMPQYSSTPQPHHQHRQVFQHQDNVMSSPEIFDLQPSYDVEFVYPPGMDPDAARRRMTPQISQHDDEEGGPTTAEIIAAQSQDYVDERLAEYQATIQHLQDLGRNVIATFPVGNRETNA
ncbi:unnamed protein product [Orchesella dallaii]|uniref:Uncharacterized protein n=1 Tax=Orchesella dallaii TaxID=48710 RepID=A0ABP1QUR7_9HEXA